MPGSALTVVLEELECLGYNVVYNLLQGADYGVPQTRERVMFIGSRDGQGVKFPKPTHSRNGSGKSPKWRILSEALTPEDSQRTSQCSDKDSSEPVSSPEYVPYSPERLKYLRLLKEGQNWKYLPEHLKKEAMGGAYNSGGGKVGFYRRLAWDKPSPTVTTSPHQKATDMCHPEELRPLSVRECARVQTFPDDWVFTVPLPHSIDKLVMPSLSNLLKRLAGTSICGSVVKHSNIPKKTPNLHFLISEHLGERECLSSFTIC
jgi:DNA (cytosine-5)-methyltransferase 1